jgi:hypothetical protein
MPIRRSLRRLFLRLLRGAVRLGARIVPAESPWDRVTMSVPILAFGPGSSRQFAQYFEGESSVRPESIDDIVEWLLDCQYASDTDLFNAPDYWQHPSVFEQRRRGDCEDFALWTWRKLAEMGIDAEFCVGRVRRREAPEVIQQHAWVLYRVDGTDFLFEPAARSRQHMIRELADAMNEYVPHFSVNRNLRTCAFGGFMLDAQDRDSTVNRSTFTPGSRQLDSDT